MNEQVFVESAASSISLTTSILVGVVLLVSFIAWVALSWTFRRTVGPNEAHAVQGKSGRKIYGGPSTHGNSYYNWPSWIPKIGVSVIELPLSIFSQGLSDYEAYDVGKVPFGVDVEAFFLIENPVLASQRVENFDVLKKQIGSILESAVRTILAQEDVEDIMKDRAKFGALFTAEVEDDLAFWGVKTAKNIELMDVRDAKNSKTISNIMKKKDSLIEKQSREVVAGNTRDAEIAEIEAQRETDLRREQAREVVGQRQADADKQIGVSQELAQQEIKAAARETAVRDMAVKEVNEVRASEIAKQVRVVQANEDKESKIIEADGEREQSILLATGLLEAERRKAEGIRAIGEAQAHAETQMKLAPVTADITLAKEIGANDKYQHYLVSIAEINKNQVIGVAQAEALKDAGIKIIANSGNVPTGMNSVLDLFTSTGGTQIGAVLEGLAQTDIGKSTLNALGVKTDENNAAKSNK